jgi:hypothetical protein
MANPESKTADDALFQTELDLGELHNLLERVNLHASKGIT